MSANNPAQELFPNLFGNKPVAKASARDMNPSDMRLLQYAMRQAARRPTSASRPMTGPVSGRPSAPNAPAWNAPGATR